MFEHLVDPHVFVILELRQRMLFAFLRVHDLLYEAPSHTSWQGGVAENLKRAWEHKRRLVNPIATPGRFPLSVPPYSFSMSSKVISMKTSSDESRLDLTFVGVSDEL